jgi:hypothetical protein
MAAQETYRIHETTSVVLRENDPHKAAPSDIAIVKSKSQTARLLDLLYKDAERGFEYDYIKVKRYVLYLTPGHLLDAEDGKRIGEFTRLDMAEMVCDALNAAQQAELNKTAKIEPINMAALQVRASEIAAEKLKNLRPQI